MFIFCARVALAVLARVSVAYKSDRFGRDREGDLYRLQLKIPIARDWLLPSLFTPLIVQLIAPYSVT